MFKTRSELNEALAKRENVLQEQLKKYKSKGWKTRIKNQILDLQKAQGYLDVNDGTVWDYLKDMKEVTKVRNDKEFVSTYRNWSAEERNMVMKNTHMKPGALQDLMIEKFNKVFTYRSVTNMKYRLIKTLKGVK